MLPQSHAIPYAKPSNWIRYHPPRIMQDLVEARASILSLRATPYQRDWVEKLQEIQLKMEVAGTSRIEGAEFTDRELDIAMDPRQTAEALRTRSQRQARAAAETYRWIAQIPDDRPITEDLVLEIHRRIVTGCDDDHCPPGRLRGRDQNVTFGFPRHRGCDGGPQCESAFSELIRAVRGEFRNHDPLLQAMALHYHFAAMHPFLDGNGRTARALEALLLQRAGLRDTAFVAMSNYYYEEKTAYLTTLADVRAVGGDLTAFIKFGLKGISIQCERLFGEIRIKIQEAVFRNVMYDLFNRLQSPRKRVIAARQIAILKVLLEIRPIALQNLVNRTASIYDKLQNPEKALIRDLNALFELGALHGEKDRGGDVELTLNLDWPQQITESEFMDRVKRLPKGKMHSFL